MFTIFTILPLFTLLPLYPCTLVPFFEHFYHFYHFYLVPLYPCTLVPLYPLTLFPLYFFTFSPFYLFTFLPLFYFFTFLPTTEGSKPSVPISCCCRSAGEWPSALRGSVGAMPLMWRSGTFEGWGLGIPPLHLGCLFLQGRRCVSGLFSTSPSYSAVTGSWRPGYWLVHLSVELSRGEGLLEFRVLLSAPRGAPFDLLY